MASRSLGQKIWGAVWARAWARKWIGVVLHPCYELLGFFGRPMFLAYYYWLGKKGGSWSSTFWLGHQVLKPPFDLWILQEILWDCKPDVVIETGTWRGGSALFMACVLDQIGNGEVFSIDLRNIAPSFHPRVTYLVGDCASEQMAATIRTLLAQRRARSVMVILDSAHTSRHVLRELELYSPLVSVGQYLIVEDMINGTLVAQVTRGDGPAKAVKKFLKQNSEFIVDRSREKFRMTFHPEGFLRRVKEAPPIEKVADVKNQPMLHELVEVRGV